jgi:F-type H+-transporting ATPase subunit c
MRKVSKLVSLAGVLFALSMISAAATPVQAAEEGAAGPPLNLQYAGAALGVGLVVIGAGIGIGRFAAAAAEAIARQPQAAGQITGAVNLPLFLLEGVAIIAEVACLLVVLVR